ncbi:MAG: hypothetical protein GX271_06110, partial [Clostridiales bacterium]|nr:hypothetical protein [Clostridiales bacterium]
MRIFKNNHDYHFTNYDAAYSRCVRKKRKSIGFFKAALILLLCCLVTGFIAGGSVYL